MKKIAVLFLALLAGCYYDRPNPWKTERDVERLNDKKGKVVDFEEKPPKWKSTLISIGLYYWGRQHVGLFKQYLDEGQKKDQPGYFLQWAHRKIDVYGHVIDGEWYDIGDIDSYNTANEILMKGTPG